MISVLFVGTFLSKGTGTKDVSESIAEKLHSEGITCTLVSGIENKLLRLADILFRVLFFKGDFVHINVFSGSAFRIAEYASLLASYRRKKIILTLHGGMLNEFEVKNGPRIAQVFKRAAHVQTPSLFLKQYFESKGYTISYLPNSIDLESFPFERSVVKPFSMLWVRAFGHIYNPELAVMALLEVRKKHPHATLTMVGPDKGLMPQVKRLIDEHGLNEVVNIVGPVPNEKLHTFYQTHSVYINTTSYESFGVALVEAASCGIPIVSTKVGEIPWLWTHRENMMLVDGFDAAEFSKPITELFDNEELSGYISQEAAKKAAGFTWESVRPLWLNLLKS